MSNKESKKLAPDSSIQEFYSYYYRRENHHSPEASIYSLINRAQTFMKLMSENDIVLNIGAGRQLLEKLYRNRFGNPSFNMISLDVASLKRKQLIAAGYINIDHIQADGNKLPFKDNSVNLVLSNMALDFMSVKALDEIARVLKPNGHAFVNLCFPALDLQNAPNIRELVFPYRSISRLRETELRFFKHYLTDNEILFESPEQAKQLFEEHGFMVTNTPQIVTGDYDWCAIDLVSLKEKGELSS